MGKTAVIIIHGVGEQRPMGTVSRFSKLFAGNFFRSKPDRQSKLFELRRLSTYVNDPNNPPEMKVVQEATAGIPQYPPSTVFYEFYWAFHYRDTKPVLVIRWAISTLWKLFATGQIWRLGRRVLSVAAACLLVLLVFTLTIFLIALGISRLTHPERGMWWGTLCVMGGVALPWIASAFKPFLLGWAGDAARYFGTSPDNPIERQQIREEGISLLRRLHQPSADGTYEYETIVVVGHSLGSVIAYDMLLNYWTEIHRRIEIADGDAALNAALKEIESLADQCAPPPDGALWRVPDGAPPADTYQALQKKFGDLLDKSKRVPQGGKRIRDVWRIRDLVTLGSPMTYARFLLADNGKELFERQKQRELPTCPPTKDAHPDERGVRSFVFRFSPIMPADCVVPDQTALFLLTRWTNLYFPQDPIGGPLRPIFGWGIRDLRVDFCAKIGNSGTVQTRPFFSRLLDLFGGAHVRYWELIKDDPARPSSAECAEVLRKIVRDG